VHSGCPSERRWCLEEVTYHIFSGEDCKCCAYCTFTATFRISFFTVLTVVEACVRVRDAKFIRVLIYSTLRVSCSFIAYTEIAETANHEYICCTVINILFPYMSPKCRAALFPENVS
jgi:hypothetical protein